MTWGGGNDGMINFSCKRITSNFMQIFCPQGGGGMGPLSGVGSGGVGVGEK